MMEDHEFCDNCPGCRPAIINVGTGKRLPNDSPEMQAINEIWDKETTYAQRRAYIEVTLHNSKVPGDQKRAMEVTEMIQKALMNKKLIKDIIDRPEILDEIAEGMNEEPLDWPYDGDANAN